MSADGFRFCFDEEEKVNEAVHCTEDTANGHPWPTPSTLLAAFPWLPLSEAQVQAWLAHYPSTTITRSSNKSQGHSPRGSNTPGQTRPLQLQLPTCHTSTTCDAINNSNAVVATICYQTAPELSVLTGSHTNKSNHNAHNNRSETGRDIVPGKYYGGLKVWSCAAQLVNYLGTHATLWQPRLQAHNAIVAEVGCGQGLGGLAALCLGATRVIFQDYNAEVLERCVQPNIAATCRVTANINTAAQVKLVHGDWVDLRYTSADVTSDTFSNSSSNGGCDVILGSDVTFDAEACDKLACLLQRWLRVPDGVALIASKVYYFGTNGGVVEFTQCAQRLGLVVREVHKVTEKDTAESVGMQQVILQVTRA